MSNLRQIPLTCSGHTRPVVHLDFNRDITECGYFLISACKGRLHQQCTITEFNAQYALFTISFIQFRISKYK